MKTPNGFIAAAIVFLLFAIPAYALVIVGTDFTDRTISGTTATITDYTLNGVESPGNWTVVDATGIFGAADRLAVQDNPPTWSVTLPLTVGATAINLTDVTINFESFSNAGASKVGANFAPANNATVEIRDSLNVLLATQNIAQLEGVTADYWIGTYTNFSTVTLAAGQVYSLKITTGGSGGNNLGIDSFAINGTFTAADTTPPTLTSFVDDQGGTPVVEHRPVTYTLTFSEAMNASTISTDDFDNNDVNTDVTINSVAPTANPAVFLVTVTPTEAGTLHLRIKAGAILKDTAGNNLDTLSAILNDTPILVEADTTAPNLISFVDDKSGGPIGTNQIVTYTVTFDEAMNASTVDALDFENASATATTIGSVTPTANPAVFLVDATPTAAGTLQLRIKAGATLTDLKGNAMVTGSGIADDTTLVVNSPPTLVCPLGVLNLSANSGINPATGQLWQVGDKYRLIFVTSGNIDCSSTNITSYNTGPCRVLRMPAPRFPRSAA